jgi:hypothetical protein
VDDSEPELVIALVVAVAVGGVDHLPGDLSCRHIRVLRPQ